MKADIISASDVILVTAEVSFVRTSGTSWRTSEGGAIVIPTGHRVVLELSNDGVFRVWREPAGEEK